jgi:predicted nucleic acid-binding protein
MRRIQVKAINKMGMVVKFDAMGTSFITLLQDAKRRLSKRLGNKARYYKLYIEV